MTANRKRLSSFRPAALTLLAFIALWLTAGCQTDDGDSWNRIEASGALRIGLDPTYPPFETADDGELRGLDVDLARAVAADLRLEAQFVYFGYDGLYDALLSHQVDVLISALVIMPERTRDFAYSDGYFNAGLTLVIPRGSDDQVMADLARQTLAVELGSQGHLEAVTWQRRLTGLEITPFNAPGEAVAAVDSGAADAALVDAVSARLAMGDYPALRLADQPVTAEPYAMVVRAADRQLLTRLNESLAALAADGRLASISRRWLDE